MKSKTVSRVFSNAGVDPFDEVKWDKRTAEITDDKSQVIFRQTDVLVPEFWSQLATKVVVSKYFYGEQGTSERENSVRQLIHRVCRTIADWGVKDGYFSKEDGDVFYSEMVWLCLHQYSGSTLAYTMFTESERIPREGTGFTTQRPRRLSEPQPSTSIRNAARAAFSPSGTTWSRSWSWPKARPCSSNLAPVQAPI